MKSRVARFCALALMLLVASCIQDQTVAPKSDPLTDSDAPLAKSHHHPSPAFYTFATNHDPTSGAFTELERIDTSTGQGTILWQLGIPLTDPVKGLSCPLGLVFDDDGTMYTIVDWVLGPDPEHNHVSEFARVNVRTGHATIIGGPLPIHFSSTVIDHRGTLYAMGFNRGPDGQNPPLVFFGDGCLYRFNKCTGAATRIGSPGLMDIMDMAFDSHDRLWATTENNLYLINTRTAHSTLVTHITGVPVNKCGIQLEVMSIGFDEHDVLYATAIQGFADSCYETTPVMTINTHTGAADVIGWTGQWYNHGGDILPPR